MRLILIEGVPGSGKSTLAKNLCEVALSKGLCASWFLEESRDHPVHPKKETRSHNLDAYFLQQWTNFISVNASRDHLFILEGSLFQSTIRFMIEADRENLIPGYFALCQRLLAKLSSELIYLRPPDIPSHIDWTSTKRGVEWTGKVSNYLQGTPFCKKRGWSGERCMSDFWAYYADRCDLLVNNTTIPRQIITSGPGYFESQLMSALAYTKLN